MTQVCRCTSVSSEIQGTLRVLANRSEDAFASRAASGSAASFATLLSSRRASGVPSRSSTSIERSSNSRSGSPFPPRFSNRSRRRRFASGEGFPSSAFLSAPPRPGSIWPTPDLRCRVCRSLRRPSRRSVLSAAPLSPRRGEPLLDQALGLARAAGQFGHGPVRPPRIRPARSSRHRASPSRPASPRRSGETEVIRTRPKSGRCCRPRPRPAPVRPARTTGISTPPGGR